MAEAASNSTAILAVDLRDIYRYHYDEMRRWREWLQKQPAAVLDVAVGEPPVTAVRDLLFHIAIVEWVYVRALNGEPWDGWQKFQRDSLAAILEALDEAERGMNDVLARETQESLNRESVLAAPQMTLKGTRRKFLLHTFMHSTRHLAQLAMVLRAAGYKTDWQHDLVMSDVIG